MTESHEIDLLVGGLASVRDEELQSLGRGASAEALFEEIAAHPVDRRRLVTRRVRRLALAAAAASIAAAATLVGVEAFTTAPAGAGIEFERREGYLVARVVEMRADPAAMRAAFRDHGLDIDLELVPVSPSLVGEIVASSESGPGIEHLSDPARGCPQETRCGPIGLRIPLAWDGEADIVLGREALASESYVSAGDAFAQGEALHCATGVVGATVAAARGVIDKRGLDVIWHVNEEIDGRVIGRVVEPTAGIGNWIVVAAIPASAGSVHVFAEKSAPASAAFRRLRDKLIAAC
jgi:hypothetical protein